MTGPGEIAARFRLPGPPGAFAPLGGGHINVTFLGEAGGRAFVLQRINGAVFPDPLAVMANMARVTAHLGTSYRRDGTPEPERRALSLVPARDGRAYVEDAEGALWRCCPFITGGAPLPSLVDGAQGFAVARAYGDFLRRLGDLPGPPLAETIPHFHDGARRFAAFQAAVAADPHNRAGQAREEIDGALREEALAGLLTGLRARGELPLRPTHHDTKLDNLLFDAATGEALCVLDLDTVMPGLALGDFADLARSAACRVAEDARDLARVGADPGLFGALARGFAAGLGEPLLPLERELLLAATQAFALVLGLRFLTDHLEGDRYFRIHRPGQNLDRARAQLALLDSLRARAGELEAALTS